MHTQKQFAKELKETVNKLMGEGYRVEIHHTEKVNVETVHALVIFNSENKVSPNFYIEHLYEDYQQGYAAVQEIAESIAHAYHCNASMSVNNRLKEYFSNDGWMKGHLFLQLINSSRNRALLKNSIYMDFSGLSLVLYVMVSNDEEGICKARVTTGMCGHFGWNKNEVLNHALENTAHLLPYTEFPLHELLQKAAGCTGILPGMDIQRAWE